MPRATPEQ